MKITDAHWMFLDTETTGLKPEAGAQIIELGWVSIKNMVIEGSTDHLINPGKPIPPEVSKINHIFDADVQGQPTFQEVMRKFLPEFMEADFIMAYNKDFDRKMLEAECSRVNITLPQKIWMDPIIWSRKFLGAGDNRLAAIAEKFKVSLENAHRADADAKASAEIAIKFFEWGVDEANFPDDVEQMKSNERGWRTQNNAQGKYARFVDANKTGTPNQVAQNVYDNYNRDRLFKLGNRGRWGK